ncbi:hypothetical protein BDY21DRAFT_63851 [Lineolata rhizophorae]|uniref:Uncharacterized protein n=1 Tax=Lineolata rhizophorae TaxID=578093 RepID=A0A6A6NW29_9PEZI|nr:hypothetical protein BDY21DRAFT_63851 [Lineolata rhizophorae]
MTGPARGEPGCIQELGFVRTGCAPYAGQPVPSSDFSHAICERAQGTLHSGWKGSRGRRSLRGQTRNRPTNGNRPRTLTAGSSPRPIYARRGAPRQKAEAHGHAARPGTRGQSKQGRGRERGLWVQIFDRRASFLARLEVSDCRAPFNSTPLPLSRCYVFSLKRTSAVGDRLLRPCCAAARRPTGAPGQLSCHDVKRVAGPRAGAARSVQGRSRI